ncbi:MAG: undecaprenyl-diphosphate phosphatase [Acidimicrobiia bacterium]|nr:undecaprenyl-diphosphate phosphatase [Acidimicrobiia bacterium]
MIEAIIWGVVQGLTEFLPVSSSGHLVLIPALLGMEPPDLATSAVLHIGTLVAVLAYYRRDLASMLAFRTDPAARRLVGLLAVGTAPAIVGVLVRDTIGDLQESLTAVSIALLVTGVVLFASGFLGPLTRRLDEGRWHDALVVGIAQVLALIPGISRSGMTITAGMGRRFVAEEAARFSFLLAVPAIAGAALIEGLDLMDAGGVPDTIWIGVATAAISGYAAIAFLLRMVGRLGLRPFAYYTVIAGIVGLVIA